MFLSFFKNSKAIGSIFVSLIVVAGATACGKVPEAADKQPPKVVESTPAAPTMAYEQLIISDDSVGNTFKKRSLEAGNSIDYVSRAGITNILDNVVEYPDATGYVKIEKAYLFGTKYLLIVSTGENGASCPATTYAISFDTKTESVTGKEQIDGCSENLESLSDGNKLIVKKDGATSTFYNAEINQAALSPKASANTVQIVNQESVKTVSPQPVSKKKMMGDVIDDNPNANPNNAAELKNKLKKREWQDDGGFVHYPDGSVTNGPID